MSAKFAAWLHVTPAPTTLAESSAVYQVLRKHGRISAFIRSEYSRREKEKGNTSSATFYTVFPHEPPNLEKSFRVPVYHNLPNARDEDPFNIRGLQTRKPMPEPKTFTCTVEAMAQSTARFEDQAMIDESPYHGQFRVQKNDWLRDALFETNAPPGIPKGCANRVIENEKSIDAADTTGGSQPERPARRRKINMRSLMEMWKEASELQRQKEESKEKQQGPRRALSADKPFGIL